jgi:hypothetical protein
MTAAALQDALLGDAALGQLLFDIEHAARLVAIIVRPLGPGHTAAACGSLAEAHQILIDRRAGIQVRYEFGGEAWWDTLLPTATGASRDRTQERPGQSVV